MQNKKIFGNDNNTQNNNDEEVTDRGKQSLKFQFTQTWNLIEWYVPKINNTVIVMLLYMGVGGSDLKGRVYTDVIQRQ
jgi:glucose-6-phosphate isomerase